MHQTWAQQGREVAPAPASMRRKLEAIVAERTGIDALAVDEEAGLDVLQRVDAGAWIDTDEGKRLKLAWQSCATGDYLLLDQRGRKEIGRASCREREDDTVGWKIRKHTT